LAAIVNRIYLKSVNCNPEYNPTKMASIKTFKTLMPLLVKEDRNPDIHNTINNVRHNPAIFR
jgi:hypothetical protein